MHSRKAGTGEFLRPSPSFFLNFFDSLSVQTDASVVSGQLGLAQSARMLPSCVFRCGEGGGSVVDLAAGLNHTVVALQSGVYSCGSNAFQQLGRQGNPLALERIPQLNSVVCVSCGDQVRYRPLALVPLTALG